MATYLITHEVDDVEHWWNSPKREEVFGPLGREKEETAHSSATPGPHEYCHHYLRRKSAPREALTL